MSLRSWIASLVSAPKQSRPVQASYDAARDGNETVNIWSNVDGMDADAANSAGVRAKLRNRDRYERANNGRKCGVTRTQANFVVGTGPRLKMQTGSAGFNAMVEAKWNQWCIKSHFARKLRQMDRAKTGDGEALALIVTDENIDDPVKLNLRTIECDRLTCPTLRTNDEYYVDGVHFDEFGTPTDYDILRRHPGAQWYKRPRPEFDTYPAERVCHWYLWDRPEQHRGIPELTATLNLSPTARRFREATVAAAETAADFSLIMEMGAVSDEPDEVAPFTTLPIDKRTMMVSPAGAKSSQLKAEHPATTYEMFNQETASEEFRPINMPRNLATCDSSGYSYSGGQLDHQPYFVSVQVEQQECEEDVVDKVFTAWFRLAVAIYGWNVADSPSPKHGWGWPGKPHNDPVKTATSRKIELATGQITHRRIFSEDGLDFDDELREAANDYGVTEDEVRAKWFAAIGGGTPQVQSESTRPDRAENNATNEEAANRPSVLNGNGRFSI
jgi:capsid protein